MTRSDDAEIELACADLAAGVAELERLGFRLHTIFPADDPRTARLRGHSVALRLVRGASSSPAVLVRVPSFVVTRSDANAWHVGRAGMHYRDLVPDRQGGRFIASHIRIEDGGPVPDYVHYHEVRCQLIYCRAGWVRLVYEDQGPPFTMHAGACVIQPPEIRHRVLEASPGLEVVEVGSPAEHPTHIEHVIDLPTSAVRPERAWKGQRFIHARPGPEIAAATAGVLGAVIRRDAPSGRHDHELYFGFVLDGAVTIACEGTRARIGRDDAFTIPRATPFTLEDPSADLAWLEVTAPA